MSELVAAQKNSARSCRSRFAALRISGGFDYEVHLMKSFQ